MIRHHNNICRPQKRPRKKVTAALCMLLCSWCVIVTICTMHSSTNFLQCNTMMKKMRNILPSLAATKRPQLARLHMYAFIFIYALQFVFGLDRHLLVVWDCTLVHIFMHDWVLGLQQLSKHMLAHIGPCLMLVPAPQLQCNSDMESVKVLFLQLYLFSSPSPAPRENVNFCMQTGIGFAKCRWGILRLELLYNDVDVLLRNSLSGAFSFSFDGAALRSSARGAPVRLWRPLKIGDHLNKCAFLLMHKTKIVSSKGRGRRFLIMASLPSK